jgi:hypothetical protein
MKSTERSSCTERSYYHIPELADVTGAFLPVKPASAGGNLESAFPLQFHLPYFIAEYQSPDLQLLCRPCTFWKYSLTCGETLILKC